MNTRVMKVRNKEGKKESNKKNFHTQQIFTCHLFQLIMAFIWSSIHKLKLYVFNHSLACYKALCLKTLFDQKASLDWFLQLWEITANHFSISDRQEEEEMNFKMGMVW